MREVRIEWYDSNALHGWQYGEFPAELAFCRTRGIVIEEDNNKIVVAQTDSNLGARLGVIVIAKGCIKSIREMRMK